MVFPDIQLEQKLWNEGYTHVVGIDEAGRGPLAGPVVAGAVVIHNKKQMVEGVRDSKKMSEKKREVAYELITTNSASWGVGIVTAKEIDKIGILLAVQKAMQGALGSLTKRLGENINYLIVDGKNVLTIPGYPMDKITKGDNFHYSIAAGSVLAKVTRDRIMKEYAIKYPQYGFMSHVGYGTKKHMEALKEHGACDIHRRSFKPVETYG